MKRKHNKKSRSNREYYYTLCQFNEQSARYFRAKGLAKVEDLVEELILNAQRSGAGKDNNMLQRLRYFRRPSILHKQQRTSGKRNR